MKGASPFFSPQGAYLVDCAIRSLSRFSAVSTFIAQPPPPTPVLWMLEGWVRNPGVPQKGALLGQGSDGR